MSHRIKPEKVSAVYALADRGLPQRDIAAAVNISKGAVSNLITARKRGRSTPRRAPTAPKIVPKSEPLITPTAARRAELTAAVNAAEAGADDEEMARALLALYRHDHPDLDRHMTNGESLVSVLEAEEIFLLRRPEDIAELAQVVTEEPGFGWVKEDGECDEAFAAFMRARGEAERQRAIDLLTRALEIAKARPVAARWILP